VIGDLFKYIHIHLDLVVDKIKDILCRLKRKEWVEEI
jgi:hypothetical protein